MAVAAAVATAAPAGGAGAPVYLPRRLHVSNIPFRFRESDLRDLLGVRILTSCLTCCVKLCSNASWWLVANWRTSKHLLNLCVQRYGSVSEAEIIYNDRGSKVC